LGPSVPLMMSSYVDPTGALYRMLAASPNKIAWPSNRLSNHCDQPCPWTGGEILSRMWIHQALAPLSWWCTPAVLEYRSGLYCRHLYFDESLPCHLQLTTELMKVLRLLFNHCHDILL
jgi:hypothetical protein